MKLRDAAYARAKKRYDQAAERFDKHPTPTNREAMRLAKDQMARASNSR